MASSTAPRGLHVLAVRLFTTCSLLISFAYLTCSLPTKLRLAYILCYFIRKLRLAYVVSFGFLNEEYLIALVDFIVALRRTKGRGRRTLRSPPSPSSGLHLIHPGCPLRRGMTAAAVYANIGFLYPVQVAHRQFRILCSYLCSGWYRSRFSWGVGLVSHVFHYWGIGCSCLRLRGVFAMVYRWICADRDWGVCFCG